MSAYFSRPSRQIVYQPGDSKCPLVCPPYLHISPGANKARALKWHYDADKENQTLSEARSSACEIVAWRFLTRLSEREAVSYCLYEIPCTHSGHTSPRQDPEAAGEATPLLRRATHADDGEDEHTHRPAGSSSKRSQLLNSVSRLTNLSDAGNEQDPTASFKNLNALEIAAIANAKRFLSQHVVQKIITGIWNGDIVFWDSLSVHSTKQPRFYNPATADPFSRLRVPKYLKCWEVLFFSVFLCLYYAVLLNRVEHYVTAYEIALFFWIAAYFYDELSEWNDAGSIFYATDIWNVFDMIMVIIGFTFAGLSKYTGNLYDACANMVGRNRWRDVPRRNG